MSTYLSMQSQQSHVKKNVCLHSFRFYDIPNILLLPGCNPQLRPSKTHSTEQITIMPHSGLFDSIRDWFSFIYFVSATLAGCWIGWRKHRVCILDEASYVWVVFVDALWLFHVGLPSDVFGYIPRFEKVRCMLLSLTLLRSLMSRFYQQTSF